MTFAAGAARVRGVSHRAVHTPCQDFAVARGLVVDSVGLATGWAAERAADIVVGVLGDGGGSAAQSHIGSRLAAQAALQWVVSRLGDDAFDANNVADGMDAAALDTLWGDAFFVAREAVIREARTRRQIRAEEPAPLAPLDEPGLARPFATTLLAFIASRRRAALAQVGDGYIVVGAERGGALQYELAFANTKYEEANQVVWLTASEWTRDFRTRVVDGPIASVWAGSDGAEKVALAIDG